MSVLVSALNSPFILFPSIHLTITHHFFLLLHVHTESGQPIQGSLQSLNLDALIKHTFVPDYSVRAITEVFYIAIKRTLYLAAKRATLMERAQKLGTDIGQNEPMDDEVEKVDQALEFSNQAHISLSILSFFSIVAFAFIG